MKKTIEEQIKELEVSLTGDLMMDMDIKDQIHKLKMDQKGVSCDLGEGGSDCIACGS